jgi:PEP-CTERM motif
MKICLKKLSCCAAMALAGLSMGTRASADPISLSVEAAGLQTSTVPGVTTETFNEFSTGQYSSLSTAVGTLTTSGSGAIVVADIFGGAGGTGNYFAVGAQSGSADPVTLTFSGPQSYFGLWWSAADANNTLTFLSGTTVLETFTTATAFAGLGSSYYGNPNNGGDTGEPFAYMNFNGVGGTTFTSVVFSNNNTTGTGFESDNWSINAVPEPSSFVLSGTAAVIVGLALRRRRARA